MIYLQKLYESFVYQDLYLIFISILIGLIIGWEREYRNKTAGLRTLMLVSVGSCIFTILSLKIGVDNPDRLAANIITGIGFLGAGAIFKDENKINGITTACTIWVTAALGMCIGSGHIFLAIISATVVFFVLWNLLALEKWIDNKHKISDYRITTIFDQNTLSKFETLFTQHHLKYVKITLSKTEDKIMVHWKLEGTNKQHLLLSQHLLSDTSIIKLEL